MTIPFSGPATPLGPNDITEAAASLGCDAAAVKAVITVEAGPGGGFLSDGSGRPKILFEAFDFSRATGGVYDATHPTISAPSSDWKLYVGGAGEYARLAQAMTLNPTAALASASWGLFQIMGNNFKLAGYESVQTYVTAMCQGEGPQLAAFVSFCELAGLARFLVAHDWASFALHYNGVLYKKNQYDTRLAAAWAGDRRHGNGGRGPPGSSKQGWRVDSGRWLFRAGYGLRSDELSGFALPDRRWDCRRGYAGGPWYSLSNLKRSK
jgi:hypothetical protein